MQVIAEVIKEIIAINARVQTNQGKCSVLVDHVVTIQKIIEKPEIVQPTQDSRFKEIIDEINSNLKANLNECLSFIASFTDSSWLSLGCCSVSDQRKFDELGSRLAHRIKELGFASQFESREEIRADLHDLVFQHHADYEKLTKLIEERLTSSDKGQPDDIIMANPTLEENQAENLLSLQPAIERNDLVTIQNIIASNPELINAVLPNSKEATPLIVAARVANAEVIKFLLGLPDVNINAKDATGATAVMCLMEQKKHELVSLILRHAHINKNEATIQEVLSEITNALGKEKDVSQIVWKLLSSQESDQSAVIAGPSAPSFLPAQKSRQFVSIAGLTHALVPGDGHCLYNAIALYLGHDVQTLRSLVSASIEHHKEKYRPFFASSEGRTIEDYIIAVRDTNEWAGDLEISILIRLLDRPIISISPDGTIVNGQVFELSRGEPIFVYYDNVNHYDGAVLQPGCDAKSILKGLQERTQERQNAEQERQRLEQQNTLLTHARQASEQELTQERQVVKQERLSREKVEQEKQALEQKLAQHQQFEQERKAIEQRLEQAQQKAARLEELEQQRQQALAEAARVAAEQEMTRLTKAREVLEQTLSQESQRAEAESQKVASLEQQLEQQRQQQARAEAMRFAAEQEMTRLIQANKTLEQRFITQEHLAKERSENVEQEKQRCVAYFLKQVVSGQQEEAEKILSFNREIALGKGDVTDHAGRTFTNITGFQYAVWALDWRMWKMILKYLLPLYQDAAKSQLEQGLNGSWVREYHQNAEHLLKTLIEKIQNYIDKNQTDHSAAGRRARWTVDVGGAQRNCPIHVLQEYCHPTIPFYPTPLFTEEQFPRKLNVDISRCGVAYGLYRGRESACAGQDIASSGIGDGAERRRAGGYERDALQRLLNTRIEQFKELAASLGSRQVERLMKMLAYND